MEQRIMVLTAPLAPHTNAIRIRGTVDARTVRVLRNNNDPFRFTRRIRVEVGPLPEQAAGASEFERKPTCIKMHNGDSTRLNLPAVDTRPTGSSKNDINPC